MSNRDKLQECKILGKTNFFSTIPPEDTFTADKFSPYFIVNLFNLDEDNINLCRYTISISNTNVIYSLIGLPDNQWRTIPSWKRKNHSTLLEKMHKRRYGNMRDGEHYVFDLLADGDRVLLANGHINDKEGVSEDILLPPTSLSIFHNTGLAISIPDITGLPVHVLFKLSHINIPGHLPKNALDYFSIGANEYPYKWHAEAKFYRDERRTTHTYSIPIHRYIADEVRDMLVEGITVEYTPGRCYLHLSRTEEHIDNGHLYSKQLHDLETKLARVSEWEKNNA